MSFKKVVSGLLVAITLATGFAFKAEAAQGITVEQLQNSKRVALVLGGGGMRGSYQAGVIKALEELGIDYDIIVGSSVGSLNGAALAQGMSADEVVQVWKGVKQSDIYNGNANPSKVDKVIDRLTESQGLGDLVLIGRALFKGNLDVSPYYSFVDNLIDENKVVNSDKDFYVNTICISRLKYMEVKMDNSSKVEDYIKASSAAYPVFPMYKIDNKKYIDGSYMDAVPIDCAKKAGAEYIIAVDISGQEPKAEKVNDPNVVYLQGKDLGSFLNFNQSVKEDNIEKGYNDTMEYFER